MPNKQIFNNSDSQMKMPPSLAPFGKTLSMPGGQLFFYDLNPDTPEQSGGKQNLVFIHGLGDEADTWRHILPLLYAKGYRCIAPDLPGFGRSIWHGLNGVSCQANAVLRLMAELGIENAVLIGSSMGCGVAELAAFKRSDLVQSMIFIDGCFPVHGGLNRGMFLLGLPFIGRKWYRAFRKNHEAAWKSLFAYYYNLDAMIDEDKNFLRERVIARVECDNQERGYFASLRSINAAFIFKRGYFSRKIKKFKGKLFLLWGEQDRVMQVKNADLIRALRPDAPLEIVAGAGHLPHQEKPAQTAEAILSFLESVNG